MENALVNRYGCTVKTIESYYMSHLQSNRASYTWSAEQHITCCRGKYRSSVWSLLQPGGLLVSLAVLKFWKHSLSCSIHGYAWHIACTMQTQAFTAGVYTYTNSTSRILVSNSASAMQVITSCNSTQQELMQEFTQQEGQTSNNEDTGATNTSKAIFEYVDHVRTYPKFKFGGVEGTRVCTIAFRKPI